MFFYGFSLALFGNFTLSPKIIKALTLGIKYQDNPSLSRRYFLQTMTYMAQDGLISQDELENIKQDVKEVDK